MHLDSRNLPVLGPDDATLFFRREAALCGQGLRCRALYEALAKDIDIPRRYSAWAVAQILRIREKDLANHIKQHGAPRPCKDGKIEFFPAETICDYLIAICEAEART